MRKGILSSTKAKVIAFIIIALIIVGAIIGFLLYRNNTLLNEKRTNLVAEIHKNHLTQDNADYLQLQKDLNIEQWVELKDIDKKADDEKLNIGDITNLRKQQASILDPINKKLETQDRSLTDSLNNGLNLLSASGLVVNDSIIKLDDIKSITGQTVTLQKTVNENIPLIQQKKEALSKLRKVSYDKKGLLKGDFASLAGTYININGKEIIINSNGSKGKDALKTGCKGSKAKLNKLGYYSWGIGCRSGSGGSGFFFPIGVPVKIQVDGRTITVPSDTSKNRVSFGQQLANGTQYYYARK